MQCFGSIQELYKQIVVIKLAHFTLCVIYL